MRWLMSLCAARQVLRRWYGSDSKLGTDMKDVESTGPARQDLSPSHWQRTRLRLASKGAREVRRALFGPGLWPGPRRQARRVCSAAPSASALCATQDKSRWPLTRA